MDCEDREERTTPSSQQESQQDLVLTDLENEPENIDENENFLTERDRGTFVSEQEPVLIDLENEPEEIDENFLAAGDIGTDIKEVLERVSQSFRPGVSFVGRQMALPSFQPTTPLVWPRRLPPLTAAPEKAWKDLSEEPEVEEPEGEEPEVEEPEGEELVAPEQTPVLIFEDPEECDGSDAGTQEEEEEEKKKEKEDEKMGRKGKRKESEVEKSKQSKMRKWCRRLLRWLPCIPATPGKKEN